MPICFVKSGARRRFELTFELTYELKPALVGPTRPSAPICLICLGAMRKKARLIPGKCKRTALVMQFHNNRLAIGGLDRRIRKGRFAK